jgi:hypothetical protein
MHTRFVHATDKKCKVTIQSSLLYALWRAGAAHVGGRAPFEVATAMVGEGAAIEICGRSEKGRKLGRIRDHIRRNRFFGTLDIPEKVDPDDQIFFEVKLPKLGLSMQSNRIPARPQIRVATMAWDRREVRRGDDVSLSVEFEAGIRDGDEANVIIYEYDPDGNHDKVIALPAVIRKNRIELQWRFEYQFEAALIPTAAELAAYGRPYHPPQYFFIVQIDAERIGMLQEGGLMTFADAVRLHAAFGGRPAAHYRLEVEPATGTTQTWQLDAEGTISVDRLPPGKILIRKALAPAPGSRPSSGAGVDVADQLTNAKRRIVTAAWGLERLDTEVCTGEDIELQLRGMALLVDAHMHVQSNNCCPLPLQWALLAGGMHELSRGLIAPARKPVDRHSLADTAAGFMGSLVMGRLGKIGRVSTDLVAKVFIGQACSSDMNEATKSVLLSRKEWERLTDEQRTRKAAEKARLEQLSEDTLEDYTDNFIDKCFFYYANATIARMHIALPMDMSYGHYWGTFGIPVYLSCDGAMYYPNDFIQLTIKSTLDRREQAVSARFGALIPASAYSECLRTETGAEPTLHDRIHLYSRSLPGDVHHERFSLQQQFENYEAYLGAIRLQSRPAGHFFIHFEKDLQASRQLLKKRHVHFVSIVPLENDLRFEDYQPQLARTQGAAIQFPLQIIPFYHFDPRRHFDSATARLGDLAAAIARDHAFFTCRYDDSKRVRFTDGSVYTGALVLQPHEVLNREEYHRDLLEEKMIPLVKAYENLLDHPRGAEGLFWGIKMYPRLGYAPDDFATYPHLADFYQNCMDHRIPITAHCSRGGMKIADYFNFQRYDEHHTPAAYDLQAADETFADHHAAPVNWENVLSNNGGRFARLKLCLAHFGGYDIWKLCHGFKGLEAEPGTDPQKLALYRAWISRIAEMVQRYDNVYTDLSYFLNPDPAKFLYDLEELAGDLVYLLGRYGDLKDRLLMGSDWYMIEQEASGPLHKFKGVGAYYRKMFLMLQHVSRTVGYDAWHQFSVVNPLRYLGLIREDKAGAGPFEIDVAKLERFTNPFEKYWGDTDWQKSSFFNGRKGDIKEQVALLLAQFRHNAEVADSGEIKRNGKLLILSQ